MLKDEANEVKAAPAQHVFAALVNLNMLTCSYLQLNLIPPVNSGGASMADHGSE